MARVSNWRIKRVTAAYTVAVEDELIEVDASSGAITITLPTTFGKTGREVTIRKTDTSTNAVSIVSASGETVGSLTTLILNSPYQSVSLIADGLSSGDWSIKGAVGYSPTDLTIKNGSIILDQLAQTLVVANATTLPSSAGLLIVDLDASRNLDTTPHISDGFIGQILTIHVHNKNTGLTLTLNDEDGVANSGLKLGAATRVMGGGDTIVLMFISDLESVPVTNWQELSFTTTNAGV